MDIPLPNVHQLRPGCPGFGVDNRDLVVTVNDLTEGDIADLVEGLSLSPAELNNRLDQARGG